MKKLSCLYLILAISLSGCAVAKPKIDTGNPPDTRSILATLKTRCDLVSTMRTLANIKISSHGKGDELRGYLNYEKPDKLSVYAMGAFNEPRVIALAVEKSLQIYFVAENELLKGELSDAAIKDIFNIDLRISDIRSSIFANPFLDGSTDNLKLESYGDEYLVRRQSTIDSDAEEISILARNVTVNKWRILDANGKVKQEISFSKYTEVGGILRPLKAVISRPADETTISIESVNPEINVKLAKTAFALPIPDSAKIYQLSDLKKPRDPDGTSDNQNK